MRKWLALLLFPLTVQAAGEGAWQDSGMGVTLNYRGVSASSSPFTVLLMFPQSSRSALSGKSPAAADLSRR